MLKIDKYIEERSKLIDDRLKELVPIREDIPQKSLYEAANYALHPGGKRLRPILLLAAIETLLMDKSVGLDIACAIELVHNYSLIHDDLPCMDNDPIRRGKPSLHEKYSEHLALLVGDFLLTYAFEVIANCKTITNSQKNKIVAAIAKRAGGMGMVGGQVVDMESNKKELIDFINRSKTASLIIAALECGAIIARANKREEEAFLKFGKNIGMAFQIIDDFIDLNLKKEKKEKNSVVILGEKRAREKAIKLYDKGIMYLSALSYPPPLLKDLAYKLINRKI